MRWEGRRESTNVEDRRGVGRRPVALAGGLGTLVLVAVLALMGVNPLKLLESGVLGGGDAGGGEAVAVSPEEDRLKQFVAVVLADIEEVWHDEFQRMGMTYEEPKLVVFTGQVQSGCGFAAAQVGPFYCPADRTVYIDLSFFRQMKEQFSAPGDFAQAYVIAHEVGHHVQNLLGISDQVQGARGRVSEAEHNRLMVMLELQADFFAGYWAQRGQEKFKFLEPGDVEEALGAANAIGDDTLQQQAQGYVVPDSFTHGTSEQRTRWFAKGLRAKGIKEGDTFNAREL